MNKDINIILQGYQLTDKDGNSVDINESDEFRVYIENGTDGNQLLTTGTFDFVGNTYKCLVRVLE